MPTPPLLRWGAAVAALALLSCSSAETGDPPPTGDDTTDTPVQRDIEVDPEDYIDDYESPMDYDSSGTAINSAGGGSPASTVVSGTATDGGAAPPEIGPYDDNTFADPGHRPFVTTAEQDAATFGLDVDSASYTIGRQWITSGTRPEPSSIRTEEWVNAMTWGDPLPEDSLGMTVSAAPSAFGDEETLVRVGVTARETAGERRPANIVLVVDTSGSMDIADRLGAVKASLALMAQHLPDGDTLSIVTYSDDADVLLEPTPVEDTDTIIDAIESLSPMGSTNMEAGLREGYDLAAEAFRPDGINRVILATDGVANNGLTDPAAMADFIQAQAGDGIQLVTVGYGMGNLNDALMEQLSDRGDGMYAYVDRYEEAEELFAERINATIEPAALDAKAQVTFDPAAVTEWRQIGYDNRVLTDEEFEDPGADAGEVNAGQDVTALFEVHLAEGLAPEAIVATAVLRWEEPGTGEAREATMPITAGDISSGWAEAPVALRGAGAVAAAAEVLAGQPEVTERGVALAAIIAELDAAAAEADEPLRAELTELADLLRRAEDLPPAPQPPDDQQQD